MMIVPCSFVSLLIGENIAKKKPCSSFFVVRSVIDHPDQRTALGGCISNRLSISQPSLFFCFVAVVIIISRSISTKNSDGSVVNIEDAINRYRNALFLSIFFFEM